jgi:hypothetical protein
MKIDVLHDKSGNIIATRIPLPQKTNSLDRTSSLQAGLDQQLSEVDVPEEYVESVKAGKLGQLRIQVQGNQCTLVQKS